MRIATRIENMNNNLKNAYDSLEDLGVDLENTNKNLQNLSTKIDSLYDEMPKITGEGIEITLSPTRKGRMQLDLKGNTSQESYLGTNKIALTREGMETSHLYNGNYQSYYFTTKKGTTLKAGSYTLAFKLKSNNGGKFNKVLLKAPGNIDIHIFTMYKNIPTEFTQYVSTFSLAEDTEFINMFTQNAEGSDTFTFKDIMVIEGTYTTTDVPAYETYVGGQPSPSPDYPQPIHVVTGNNTIGVQGKNLFDDSVEKKNAYPSSWASSIGNEVVYNNSSATYSYINCTYLEKGETYTLSWKQEVTPESTNARTGVLVDSNDIVLETITTWRNGVNNINITPTNSGYLILSADINATDMQLEQGSTATDYVPYYHQDYPINLGSLELCKIGDYQDYLYKENENWYKYKNIHHSTFKGLSNWTYQSNNKRFIVTLSNTPKNQEKAFSNFYTNGETIGNNNYFSVASGSGYSQLLIHDERFTTKEDFNAWIENNNIEVYYILNTPTTTQITDTTLISQLNAIEKAKSSENQTNISQTNTDLPFIISATALEKNN